MAYDGGFDHEKLDVYGLSIALQRRGRSAESSHPFALHPTPGIEHEHVDQSVVRRP